MCTATELTALCELAIDAATQSGRLIESRVGGDVSVQSKSAGASAASQIVTDVDLQSQSLILSCLLPAMTTHDLGMLIEETDDDGSRFSKSCFWCVDPLDGTLPFVQNRPGYAVSIALVSREGEPLLGVVYDPCSDTLYHAIRGAGAFRNRQRWRINETQNGPTRLVEEGGAVLNACHVLENAPAAFVKNPKPEQGGGAIWDYAATRCVFDEIGAFALDRNGEALDLNPHGSLYMNERGVLYASDKRVLNELIGANASAD
ncbi:MAG: inositol monophosphatase family protein [Pseudomonadota bacterium]